MNLKTEIQETIQLHSKAEQKEKQIIEYLKENLTSQKHYKPRVDIYTQSDYGKWKLEILIQYTSLNITDIETVYSIVSQIKQLLHGTNYTLKGNTTHGGYLFQLIFFEEESL